MPLKSDRAFSLCTYRRHPRSQGGELHAHMHVQVPAEAIIDQEQGNVMTGYSAVHVVANRSHIPAALGVAVVRLAPRCGLDYMTAGRGLQCCAIHVQQI